MSGTELELIPIPSGSQEGALQAHLDDPEDAHDASAISFVPGGTIAATNVQTAILEAAAEAAAANALTGLSDVSGAPPATGEAPVWDGDSFELTGVATQAELDTRTKRDVFFEISAPGATAATGDAKNFFVVPASMDGMELTAALAGNATTGTGATTIAVRRVRSGSAVDMFSANPSIDSGETLSSTGTAGTINTSNDDLATGDILFVDLDAVGSGAAGTGITLTFSHP